MDHGTNDYLRLVADSSWLNNEQGGGRSPVDPYTVEQRSPQRKKVHKQPWRFYPNKSKTFKEIGSQKSVERSMAERLLLTELQQRHQDQLEGRVATYKPKKRRRGPRTLQPMPRMPKGHQGSKYRNSNASSSPYQMRTNVMSYNDDARMMGGPAAGQYGGQYGGGGGGGGAGGQYNDGGGMHYGGSPGGMSPKAAMMAMHGIGGGMGGMGGIGGMGGMGGGNNQNPSGAFSDQKEYYRWKEEQGTVVGAVTKQLNRYKTECKRLRKQKRATLYVLRLLEQKILELSGSNATAERIDPQAPGYEMHPEVYKILKEGRTITKGCRGIQTGSDEVDVVEDYALERSAHELGLKLVRERTTKQLDAEETAEVEEIRQRRKESDQAAKIAAEEALAQTENNATAPAETNTLVKNNEKAIGVEDGARTTDGDGKNNDTQDNNEDEKNTNSSELPEHDTSLQDKVREEHLVKRKLKFREMFDRLDVDGSGFLDKSELRKAVFFGDRELGSYINPKKFSAAFAAMDFNSNGEIPYEPFELFLMDCEDAASANLNFPDASSLPIPMNNTSKKQPKMLGDTRQEWTDEKLQTIFDRLDTNSNGTLERVEILKAAYSDKDLAQFITPSRSNQAYASMANGEPVDFDKFKMFCRKASSSKLVQVQADDKELKRFQAMFERLDANGNGSLERMELYKASHMDKELAQYVSPKQCGEAFKRMDMQNNGQVTVESFVAFCMDVSN